MHVAHFLFLAATCMDASDAEVTKVAASSGLIKPGRQYTCEKGKGDGACASGLAQKLCPATCGLCPNRPPSWTWIRRSEHFCISTHQRCDPSAKCGDKLASKSACQNAAAELGLGANVAVIQSPAAPRGCFTTMENRAYFNLIGDPSSEYDFAKSLCQLKDIASGQISCL